MCEYCNRNEKIYQHSVYGNLYLGSFGKKRTLEFEPNFCPPYAKCSSRDVCKRIVFQINFCPNCGKDLRKGE